MREDVADNAERSGPGRWGLVATIRCPGSAAIPPSRPLAGRRTSQTCAIAFGPAGDPRPRGRACLGFGNRDRIRACPRRTRGNRLAPGTGCTAAISGRQMVAPRSIIACAKSPGRSAGSSPASGRWSWRFDGVSIACRRAITRATLVSTTARALAERDRRDRRRGIVAECRAGTEVRRGCRESRRAPRHFAGAGDEVAGPGIIAEPGPFGEHSASLAAANASIVGQRAMNLSKYGITAATVVCCSITSLSQTR